MAESLFQQRMKERRSRFESPSGRMKERLRERQSQGNYDYLPRQEKSAANQIQNLAETGQLDQFMNYQANDTGLLDSFLNALKSGGTNALDLLSRGGYAAGGAMEEYAKGNAADIPARVGTELFSGVAGLKGEKKLPSDVLKETTGYGKFAQDHPIASIATDLASNLALDPSTYTGGALVKGAGKLLSAGGKGLREAAISTDRGRKAVYSFERSFQPRSELRHGVEESSRLGLLPEGADKESIIKKLQDGVYEQDLARRGYQDKYGGMAKDINKLADTLSPDEIANLETALKGGAVDLTPGAQKAFDLYDVMRKSGYQDYSAAELATGHTPVAGLENYMHNNPLALGRKDLLKSGDPVSSGHGTGLTDFASGIEKHQTLDTPEKWHAWKQSEGIKPEDYATVFKVNTKDYATSLPAHIYKVKTNMQLQDDMLSTGLGHWLEPGTNTPFALDELGNIKVRKGEALWMPKGNLKMFQQEAVSLNKPMKDVLARYDEFVAGENNGLGIFMTGDELNGLVKSFPSFTTKVPVMAVPTEIAKWFSTYNMKMGKPETVATYWDKLMGIFKNTAILSPGFLIRNNITSGFMNYVHADKGGFGMLGDYKDYLKVLYSKDPALKIGNKTVGELRDILPMYGMSKGGFAGDVMGATGIIGKAGKPFEWWRNQNVATENLHRGALFLYELRHGKRNIDAAKTVKELMFDYGDLTDFDKSVKKFVPFWTWTKNNVPLQLKMLAQAPIRYRNLAYLKQAIAGGQIDPNSPDWWNQQDVWQSKFKDKAGNNLAVSMGLPYSDLNMLSGNPTGMLGPAMTLLNTANNTDTFLDKPIRDFEGQKSPLLTVGKGEYANVPVRFKYALEGLAPILKRYGSDLSEELSRIGTGEKKPDDWYRVISKAVGIRVLPNIKEDAEKRKVLKLLGKLREFKKYQEQEGQ